MQILYFVAGLIPGLLLYLLMARRTRAGQTDTLAAMRDQQALLREQHAAQLSALRDEMARQRTELMERAEKREQDLRRENIAQFKALAADILKEQTGGLRQANTQQLEGLLRPLSENLESFRKAVTDSYIQENASRKSLTEQIDRLMKLNETIGIDARNLTSALRGNSKVQGDWGEMILQTMLENAGLQEGIHFQVQATRSESGEVLRSETGALLRPDVILYMPDSRRIIIDSKVSLTAFTDLCATTEESHRRTLARANLDSVKRHVEELASKSYQEAIKGSADQVIMFIPNEGAYISALQTDPDLWQYAWERNVAIVSPTHLFSVLKIVCQLWVQDKQNRNTLEIARRGGKLYEKVVGYVSALQDVGIALRKATDAYDVAYSRLAQGRGNIIRLAEDLRDLGAKTAKTLPPDILSMSENTDSNLTDKQDTIG